MQVHQVAVNDDENGEQREKMENICRAIRGDWRAHWDNEATGCQCLDGSTNRIEAGGSATLRCRISVAAAAAEATAGHSEMY